MGKIMGTIGVGVFALLGQVGAAETWCVAPPPAGSDSNPGTEELPFATIQKGIDAAAEGDTVIVAQGTYIENIHFNGNNITLRSTDPLDSAVAKTIIDGNQSGSVVTFSGSENETCALSGFTIQNGMDRVGAGIYGGTSPSHTRATIENNLVIGNSADSSGGGLFGCHGSIRNNRISRNSAALYGAGGLAFCDGIILNNTISFNAGDTGGGLSHCDGTIRDNLIVGNTAVRYGGGLYECWGIIQKNTIIGNQAGWSGGGLSNCIRATIENNIIAGNSAGDVGGGVFGGGMIRNNTIVGNSANLGGGLAYCRWIIENCIIWGNNDDYGYQLVWSVDPSYSCIEDWQGGGDGNIAEDPQFVDPDGPDNNAETYEDNDYHLSSSSPCIDTGTSQDASEHDIDGEPRPQGAGVDMGADEHADTDADGLPDYWERQHFGNLTADAAADTDLDGLTNAEEFGLSTDPTKADTDGDGFSDGDEAVSGTDPNNPSSAPPTADIYVNGAVGDDANDGKAPLTAKKTIQAGIDAAQTGDAVVVARGTYYENIHFKGKNIILRSMDPYDPATVATTAIDGSPAAGRGSVVTFTGTEDETCLLAGFTIRNGDAQYGGGICGGKGGSYNRAIIRNNAVTGNLARHSGGGLFGCDGKISANVISLNRAALDGGGLCVCAGRIENNTVSANWAGAGAGLSSCSGVIRNNVVTGNWGGDGGGLGRCWAIIQGNAVTDNHAYDQGGGLAFCHGTIQNNTISSNEAGGSGGGLSMCSDTIQNNVIVDNHAYYADSGGGGLALCYGTLQNNLIAGNSAAEGGGLYWCFLTIENNTIVGNTARWGSGGGICDHEARSTIRNCIIWGNRALNGAQVYEASVPSYSCIQDWNGGGEGNIADDPQFVDPDGSDDDPHTYEDNNYRLSPDSPCIDAGENQDWMRDALDLGGNPRVLDGDADGTPIVDMGAFEYRIVYHPCDDNQNLIIDDWELLYAIDAWARRERRNAWPKNLNDYDWALLELIDVWAAETEYNAGSLIYGDP